MRGDFSEVTYGYCKCGCGEKANLARQNDPKRGYTKGEPVKFIVGHRLKVGRDNITHGRLGKDANRWKGGVAVKKERNTSYRRILIPGHPRSDGKYVLEHIVVVEKMNGGPLPSGAVVHHIDHNGLNNNINNLMIFASSAEHLRFHTKERKENRASL